MAIPLSRTERQFPDINDGNVFPAVYDRRHDLSVVANYTLSPKWELGGAFIYGTGQAYTPACVALYFIDQNLVQDYGIRNSARIRPYHRLDLSVIFTPKPDSEAKFVSTWAFSVYNVYNRRNPFFIYYDYETDSHSWNCSGTSLPGVLIPDHPKYYLEL